MENSWPTINFNCVVPKALKFVVRRIFSFYSKQMVSTLVFFFSRTLCFWTQELKNPIHTVCIFVSQQHHLKLSNMFFILHSLHKKRCSKQYFMKLISFNLLYKRCHNKIHPIDTTTAQHLTLSHYPQGSLKYNIFTVQFFSFMFCQTFFFTKIYFWMETFDVQDQVLCATQQFFTDFLLAHPQSILLTQVHFCGYKNFNLL